MSENVQPATSSGAGPSSEQPGLAHYEKQRQYLKELLHNRKIIERQLVSLSLRQTSVAVPEKVRANN